MQYKGHAHVYGAHIDTDVIIPARYLSTSIPAELAVHCLEDLDPLFALKVLKDDFIVAGDNFGCGSSREHAPIAIKASGISCVIAVSFARIFYRNAINIGLPILECPEAVSAISDGDELIVDLSSGIIRNISSNRCFTAKPMPIFMSGIIEQGGLLKSLTQKTNTPL